MSIRRRTPEEVGRLFPGRAWVLEYRTTAPDGRLRYVARWAPDSADRWVGDAVEEALGALVFAELQLAKESARCVQAVLEDKLAAVRQLAELLEEDPSLEPSPVPPPKELT